MNNRKFPAILFCLICLVSCKTDRLRFNHTAEKQQIKVSVMEVTPQATPDRFSFIGTVIPSRTATVSAPHSGKLTTLSVRKGDVVRNGQILAKVESQTAKSTYKAAKASLDQARDAYDRAAQVYPQGSISEIQFIEIKTKLAQAEAAMESAAKALEDCNIKAPFAGVVSAVYVDEGEDLAIARRIASILDMNGLEIKIPVHENEIGNISKGIDALVDVPALGIESLKAKVIAKNLISSALSHSYDCNLKLDRIPQGLLPGMSVKVRFQTPGEVTLVVPSSAVQLDRNGKFVWLYDDGTVRKAYISAGGYAGKGVIVSEGLSEGDKVITAGYQKISVGMKVITE